MRGRKAFPPHSANRHALSMHAALGAVLRKSAKPYAPRHSDACTPETFTKHENLHRCQKCLRWWTTPAREVRS